MNHNNNRVLLTTLLLSSLLLLLTTVVQVVQCQTPLQPGVGHTSYVPPGGYQTWSLQTSSNTLEVDIWRVSPYKGDGPTQPTVAFAVQSDSPYFRTTSNGQAIISNNAGFRSYIVTLSSTVGYTYYIRYCNGYCPSSCPILAGAYCTNNGYCDNTTKTCVCDTIGNVTSTSVDCGFENSLWYKLLALWITLIVIAALLVLALPCIICFCCCGACAAVASSVKSPDVRNIYVNTPQYQQVPPAAYPHGGPQYQQGYTYQQGAPTYQQGAPVYHAAQYAPGQQQGYHNV